MIESSKHLAAWRASAAHAARSALARPLARGPVSVHLDFVMPRPQRPGSPNPPANKRTGDVDKLARAVLDALTGTWVVDDSDVVHLTTTKAVARPGQLAGVHMALYEIDWSHRPTPPLEELEEA